MTHALIFSLRKCTAPSTNTALQPPGWKENGSSFKPQLMTIQGQAPCVPGLGMPMLFQVVTALAVPGLPTGLEFWLTKRFQGLLGLAAPTSAALGGPEMPLPPASGSAQR